jgi:uncharacterized protein YbjT (DUF2867 family)
MILVTGATGTTGSEVVKQLAYDEFPVRALVRDPRRAAALEGPGVEIVQGDFGDPASLALALVGISRVYLVAPPGPDQVALELAFIQAAKAAKVKHIVKLSAYGASLDASWTWARCHAEGERALVASGLGYTMLRPNAFMQNMLDYVPDILKTGAFHLPAGDGRIGMVDVRDVATVALKALTEKGHDGKTYDITGPESLSYHEVASKLSQALGKTVKYVATDPKTSRKEMLERGMPAAWVEALLELFAFCAGNGGDVTTPVVSDLARKQPFTFDEFARDFAPALATL